jgi:hypothetical protein
LLSLHFAQASSSTQLTDASIDALVRGCNHLEKLSNCTQLTDTSIDALVRGCNHLEKLNISSCSKVTDSALIFLAAKCNRLRHLNLCGCCRAASVQGFALRSVIISNLLLKHHFFSGTKLLIITD